jgi:hypothetical protein
MDEGWLDEREEQETLSLQSRQVDDEDTERLVKERRKRKAASHSQSQVLDHQTQRLRSSQVGSRIPPQISQFCWADCGMGGGSGSFLKVLVNNMDVLAGYAFLIWFALQMLSSWAARLSVSRTIRERCCYFTRDAALSCSVKSPRRNMLESLRDLWTAVLGIGGCGAYIMAGFRVFRSAEVVHTSRVVSANKGREIANLPKDLMWSWAWLMKSWNAM